MEKWRHTPFLSPLNNKENEMFFALMNGRRITAKPGGRATCPSCGQTVLAKCGQIKIWHWAHITNDCDGWSEGVTAWHLDWQNRFPEEWREVGILKNNESHRADICAPNGIVVEFQHSSISPEDILIREKFYGPLMRWVFNARDAYANKRLLFNWRKIDAYHRVMVDLRWQYPRTTIGFCRRSVYLDIGENLLLHVKKIGLVSPGRGWGYLTNGNAFADGIQATMQPYAPSPSVNF